MALLPINKKSQVCGISFSSPPRPHWCLTQCQFRGNKTSWYKTSVFGGAFEFKIHNNKVKLMKKKKLKKIHHYVFFPHILKYLILNKWLCWKLLYTAKCYLKKNNNALLQPLIWAFHITFKIISVLPPPPPCIHHSCTPHQTSMYETIKDWLSFNNKTLLDCWGFGIQKSLQKRTFCIRTACYPRVLNIPNLHKLLNLLCVIHYSNLQYLVFFILKTVQLAKSFKYP